jgi:hypothetical protein
MNEFSKQITSVEEYARFGESLPTELPSVKVYLGYDSSDVFELSPAEMQRLFKEVRSHVDLWKTSSSQAKKQLRELSITAASVTKTGRGLIRGLKALGPVAQILNTVGDTSLKKSDFEGKNEALDESTLTRLNNLEPYVKILHGTSLTSLGDTQATVKFIDDFRNQASTLEARVAGKVDKLKESNSGVIGKEKTVGPMIDAFKEARARIVAQLGEGSEAAKAIQAQVDKALSELTSRQADLQRQQRLTYAIGRLFMHLQGLGYAMVDALSALTKIWLKSSEACQRLTNVASDLGSINTEETLLDFYVDFENILNDWAAIEKESIGLYRAL